MMYIITAPKESGLHTSLRSNLAPEGLYPNSGNVYVSCPDLGSRCARSVSRLSDEAPRRFGGVSRLVGEGPSEPLGVRFENG